MEKFAHQTPYAYAVNCPIKFIDRHGLAPGDFFSGKTLEEAKLSAAIDFAKCYNDNSILDNKEYGASIYTITNGDGVIGVTYSVPNVGAIDHVEIPIPAGKSEFVVGAVHTHGADDENYKSNEFSDADVANLYLRNSLNSNHTTEFVVTPTALVIEQNINTGEKYHNPDGVAYNYRSASSNKFSQDEPVNNKGDGSSSLNGTNKRSDDDKYAVSREEFDAKIAEDQARIDADDERLRNEE